MLLLAVVLYKGVMMMQYLDIVIKVGAIITALTLLWRFAATFVHLADDIKETKDYVKANLENVQDIPKIKEHCEANYLTGLRLTIMSETMPLGERIVAGKKYIEAGGNGAVRNYVEKELHANEIHHK